MSKTKNGLVTFVVAEGDVGAIFSAIDCTAQVMEISPNETVKRKAVELRHTRNQLYEQATAQGWRSM